MTSIIRTLFIAGGLFLVCAETVDAQTNSFTVTNAPPVHSRLQVSPPLADGKYPAGTTVTVTTTPDPGYVLDSAYYAVPGRFGQMYHEGMPPEFKVTIDQNKRL